MTAPTVYRSDDASAPTLTGQTGSLINLLDAILVNGYGSKAAAGWTKAYTGTNLAAFRMGAGGTSERMYLRVDDTGTTFATIRGYVTMTTISTGAEPFPQPIQANLYFYKSQSSDSVQRPWIAFATPTAFYLISHPYNVTSLGQAPAGTYNGSMFFGQYNYDGVGFVHNVAIIGHDTNTSTTSKLFNRITYNNQQSGHWCARSFLNLEGSATTFAKSYLHYLDSSTSSDNSPIGYAQGIGWPDPVTGKVLFSKIDVLANTVAWSKMGSLPGAYAPIVNSWLPNNLTVINGAGDLAGKQLMLVQGYAEGSGYNPAQIAFDLTDWA